MQLRELCKAESTLLSEQLDTNAVLQGGATVFFTLVKGRHRKTPGGGTWKSTGGTTINNQFVVSKLYYKGPDIAPGQGLTVFEFVLQRGSKSSHQIAICALHPTSYIHLARDLKSGQYHGKDADEGTSAGANQSNTVAMQHQPTPINSDPTVDAYGPMNGSQVLHSTDPVSNIGAIGSELSAPRFSPIEDINRIRDFSPYDYMFEGNNSGANQANNVAMQHQPAPINSDPTVDAYGPMNGSQVLDSTNPVSNSEDIGSELSALVFSPIEDVNYFRDLSPYDYMLEFQGNNSGENQANNVAMQHQPAPINSALADLGGGQGGPWTTLGFWAPS